MWRAYFLVREHAGSSIRFVEGQTANEAARRMEEFLDERQERWDGWNFHVAGCWGLVQVVQ